MAIGFTIVLSVIVLCGYTRVLRRSPANLADIPDAVFINLSKDRPTVSIRKILLGFGISLLSLASILALGVLFKLVPADLLNVAGHSGLRAIGAIAVAGCLLSALGSDDG